ncbi:sulfatase [Proteiniphilum sp. UBA5510]|jgi:arylsulfatase A-like enzyme|uniref:sulfatase n=1 Tax=Proteiniphilum sp. UBA5510 TaxID=1947286 RepID=UPI00257954FF|nr:sulfatase [Proteiniphilum sp. UBA5510]
MNKINRFSLPLLSALAIPSPAQTVSHPNIVLILIDDMGWKDLGVYGSDYYQTPQIDRFAQDGIRFTNGYAACTVSSPTRASIMTGKYPARLHLTDWIEGWKFPDAKLQIPDWKMFLPLEETTMAEVFKNAGYATAHVGKWHLGEDEKYWPENQGFDINVGGWAKGSPNLNKAKSSKGSNGYFSPYGNPRLKDGPEGEYLTERLAEEACNFIAENESKPFFLNLWFYNVHTPLMAKQEKVNKYQSLADSTRLQNNPVYAAMVEHVDDAVGKIINKLKQLGLYDNTIVVFTSDNGGLIGKGPRKITNNSPLRKGKGNMYEGGVRVPFIIKNLKQQLSGTTNDTPIMSIDLFPTLTELAGVKVEKSVSKSFDGASLKPILVNNKKKLKPRSLYWHYPHYHSEGATPYSAVRQGDWKLVHIIESNTYELYNLKDDLGESNNLSAIHPALTKKLIKNLEAWKLRVNAQMPVKK